MNDDKNSLPAQLSYERSGGSVSRKLVVTLLLLTGLNTLLLVLVSLPRAAQVREFLRSFQKRPAAAVAPVMPTAPQAVLPTPSSDQDEPSDAEILAEQERWMAFSQPLDRVVYEENPVIAARLLLTKEYESIDCNEFKLPTALSWTPPVYFFLKVSPAFDTHSTGATLLMHRFVSPSGYIRLIHVVLNSKPNWEQSGNGLRVQANRSIEARVIFPGTKFSKPAERSDQTWYLYGSTLVNVDLLSDPVRFSNIDTEKSRFYAGQPDPATPSAFTIAYEGGGRKGIIRGWLKDDETILLTGIDTCGGSGGRSR